LDVLGVLWHAKGALTPGQVREALDSRYAYTTIMTVLVRLLEKGLVGREPQGRAYAYRAVFSESELTARRMEDALANAHDRAAALSGFVSGLSKKDAAILRRAIAETDS
jgi:predicted transcriptional regulator